MWRINTPTRVDNKFGPNRHGFTDGDPQTATSSTQLEADWFDPVQEEICNVIELAGFSLLPPDTVTPGGTYHQMYDAIGAMIAARLPDVSGYVLKTGDTMYNAGGGSPLLTLQTSVGQDDYLRFNGSRDWLFGAQGGTGRFVLYDQTPGTTQYRWAVDPLGRLFFYGPIDIGAYGGQRQAWIDSANGNTALGQLRVGNVDGVGPAGRLDVIGSGYISVDLDVDQDIRAHRNLTADGFIGAGTTVSSGNGYDMHCGWDMHVNASLNVNAAASIGGAMRVSGRGDFDGNIDGWGVAVNNGGLWVNQSLQVNNEARITNYCEVGNFRSNDNVFVPNGYISGRQLRADQGGEGTGYDIDPGLDIIRRNEEPAIQMNNFGVAAWQIRVRRDGYFLIGQPGPGGAITFRRWDPNRFYCNITGELEVEQPNAYKDGGGPWGTRSDGRLKKDSEPYERGLEAILQLQPVAYRFNGLGGSRDDGRVYYGLTAQDVAPIMPEMVGTKLDKLNVEDDERSEILTLDVGPLTFALVNAVKELAARVEALEAAQFRGA
jgi:hypothetical protein